MQGLNVKYITNPTSQEKELCSINYMMGEDEVEDLIDTAVERIRKSSVLIPASGKLCCAAVFPMDGIARIRHIRMVNARPGARMSL